MSKHRRHPPRFSMLGRVNWTTTRLAYSVLEAYFHWAPVMNPGRLLLSIFGLVLLRLPPSERTISSGDGCVGQRRLHSDAHRHYALQRAFPQSQSNAKVNQRIFMHSDATVCSLQCCSNQAPRYVIIPTSTGSNSLHLPNSSRQSAQRQVSAQYCQLRLLIRFCIQR